MVQTVKRKPKWIAIATNAGINKTGIGRVTEKLVFIGKRKQEEFRTWNWTQSIEISKKEQLSAEELCVGVTFVKISLIVFGNAQRDQMDKVVIFGCEGRRF